MRTSWSQRLRALAPTREQLEAHPSLRRLAPWLGNPKLWHWSRRGVAVGAAVGLFIGFAIPLAQILLAAAAAVLLRVNLPVAAAGTLITNPLTVPPIYYAAYQLGAWATGSSAASSVSLSDPAGLWENIGTIGLPLLAGLGITATFAAAAAYLLISQAWAWRVVAKRRRARS
ncbi:MAG: DUF2062 domain-containing protein [Elusimicrobia bacterium]|jgi:uncharacterized protein (DUF2062 family)|nr:DUF2062 domain-containing protein [Dechloromonas sp.]TXH29173.1 MAG: DUF2062 domain-containing protein [Elusimicrobiota bacterium]